MLNLYLTNAPRCYDYQSDYEVRVYPEGTKMGGLELGPCRVLMMTEAEAAFQCPRNLSGLYWTFPISSGEDVTSGLGLDDAALCSRTAPWKGD